jgi:tripartite-type tricarboxylate transporter receptor subunit TctC
MNDLLGGRADGVWRRRRSATSRRASCARWRWRASSASLLPDTPTFDESGLPGFEGVLHYGLLAPAGTPKEIVDRLSTELRKLVADPEVQKRIHAEGGDPLTSTPAEYAADIDKEEKMWGGLVKKLGLKVE